MGRSVKKGPYLDQRLAKKVTAMEQSGKKSVIFVVNTRCGTASANPIAVTTTTASVATRRRDSISSRTRR